MNHTEKNTVKIFPTEPQKRVVSVHTHTDFNRSEWRRRCIASDTNTFGDDIALSEILYEWEDYNSIRLKNSTKKKYGYMIRTHIIPELGTKKICELTAADINAFLLNKLNRGRIDGNGGLSHSYVRSIAIIVSSALTYAAEEMNLSFRKIKVHKPIIQNTEPILLSYSEQVVLEQYITSHPCPTNTGILISLYTGLRIGEICALSWNDINMEDKTITVNHNLSRIESNDENAKTQLVLDSPKTLSSRRVVPISEKLIHALKICRNNSESDFVVSSKEGFISPRTFESRYKKTLKQCGIRPVNFHALRHTFATRCIEAGVDVKSLSEILGHANVSVTLNTYVHSSLDMKKKQMEKLFAFTM